MCVTMKQGATQPPTAAKRASSQPAKKHGDPRLRVSNSSDVRKSHSGDVPCRCREQPKEHAPPLNEERPRMQETAPPERRTGRAHRRPITQKGPRGRRSPRGPCRPPRPLAQIEKRPPRARRPALPQPGAAVLSAKAGLTAGFGMGPGDPRLCGRARGGRSPAAHGYEPARAPLPGRPWRPCSEGSYSRVDASQNPLRGCEELGLSAALG